VKIRAIYDTLSSFYVLIALFSLSLSPPPEVFFSISFLFLLRTGTSLSESRVRVTFTARLIVGKERSGDEFRADYFHHPDPMMQPFFSASNAESLP
jgi:hypothetical protein